jgi:hypothetical protein
VGKGEINCHDGKYIIDIFLNSLVDTGPENTLYWILRYGLVYILGLKKMVG